MSLRAERREKNFDLNIVTKIVFSYPRISFLRQQFIEKEAEKFRQKIIKDLREFDIIVVFTEVKDEKLSEV